MTPRTSRASSLRLRLILWTSASIALVSVLLSVTFHARMRELLTHEADERTRTLGRHLAANAELGVLSGGGELLQSALDAGLQYPDVVAIGAYDAEGAFLGAAATKEVERPAFSAVAAACAPCPLGDERLRWVVPVTRRMAGGDFFGGDAAAQTLEVAGYLVMDVSTETRRRDAQALLARGVIISTGALLLGLVVSLLLAQRLTAPLRTLAAAARQIGRGDWAVRLPERAPGELSDLARDFRAMAADLERLDAENRGYSENLEEMVAQRTRQLEDAYAHMKELNKAKDDFVATVSHDFRSPLAIILSMVQTLLAQPDMPPETSRNFLGRMERQCKRLQALVSDLLDLARIENRHAELSTVPLDALVAEQVELSLPAFSERGVALDAHCKPGVTARADRVLLERALGNLLGNALKFTPPPGRVTVRVGERNGCAWIEVADTGLGIPDADVPRLFERFFQSDRDAVKGEGSGLGLAIVAEVMRKHDGRVELDTRLGAGTTFTLTLPKGE